MGIGLEDRTSRTNLGARAIGAGLDPWSTRMILETGYIYWPDKC